MKKIISTIGLMFIMIFAVYGQSNLKQDMKEVGKDIKKTSKKIGKTSKKVGKEVGKESKKIGKEVGKESKKVGKGAKRATKNTKRAIKSQTKIKPTKRKGINKDLMSRVIKDILWIGLN